MENQIDPGTGLPMTPEEVANAQVEVSEEVQTEVAEEATTTASPEELSPVAPEAPVEAPAETLAE